MTTLPPPPHGGQPQRLPRPWPTQPEQSKAAWNLAGLIEWWARRDADPHGRHLQPVR